MNNSEIFNKDRERFNKKRAEEESFVEALERLFHPTLPEDQKAIDKIIKEVTGPGVKSPIVHITKKGRRRPRNKKS